MTNIQAINHDGQTFVTWTDAATGSAGQNYRYDLYRSTAGPITNLTSATLVQQGIFNNSGQLIGPKPFNQATRQSISNLMSKIRPGGSSLATWSGLAVYTSLTSDSAYYAVITRDITNVMQPSPLVAGSNALRTAVGESPLPIQPVLQVPSTDPSRNPTCCSISGTANLPLWVKLHGSGGNAAAWGDYTAYWGDSTMGYQDGIQSMFALYEDHSGNGIATGGVRQLIMTPQDAVWSVDGDFLSETYWFGYRDIPVFATDRTAHIYPFTQAKLGFIVPWAISNYGADPNRIYGWGESMGGYGHVNWSLRQFDLFAAIFLRIPVLGSWNQIPSLIDFGTDGSPKIIVTTTDTLPDGVTLYNSSTDTPTWIAQDCSRNLPYLSWSSGRQDTTIQNPPNGMWVYSVQIANALKTCHYGFSFIWNNGTHSASTAALEDTLLEQYQTAFARNVSYPAFTNFSLDNNYGNGSITNGDLTGCVNCGWQWNGVQETATSWSASFSNSQINTTATTDVTPRNAQLFKLTPGTSATWSSSTGQQGTATADAYGIVTATGVTVSGTITITFTKVTKILTTTTVASSRNLQISPTLLSIAARATTLVRLQTEVAAQTD